ncbi:OmpH family outer membrane protein [Acidimangrovimonas pyrenivorans]|uniref:OmpH family outer membrane protein n=1 Tax=Acidimangrovimonas pyrenivorans TaxID=2030798 RepID=A0ABV7AE51_9RHOB
MSWDRPAAVLAAGAVALLTPGALPAYAQGTIPAFPLGQPADGAPQSAILTLDQDRLFTESAFGKRVARDIDTAQQALLAENRKIEARLSAEEKSLTEKRPTMAPDAFRKLADDFDARVQKIRHEQDAKNQRIAQMRDSERKRFFKQALPVLGRMVRESGAVAILNSQAVFLSLNSVDITDRAIKRIDAVLGDGSAGAPDPTAVTDGAATADPAPQGGAPDSGSPGGAGDN